MFFFLFILGLAVGSFLNVLIDRLPKGESIMGRSHCDYCRRNLQWHELIPVVSFIIQRGKSRCCGKKISWQYPIVELLIGLIFVLIFNFKFLILNYFQLIMYLGIVSCLIVIFFTDLKYQIIPDSIQVAFLTLIVMLNLFQHPFSGILKLVQDDILAGLIIMSLILLLYLITRGRGMGFGDVKLAFSMGLLLGIKGGLVALYLAFIIGALAGSILILLHKKKLKSKIAFGPFLVTGTTIMLFWGEKILKIIGKIYGL